MTFPDRIAVMHRLTSKPTETSDRVILDAVCWSIKARRPSAKFEEDIAVYDYQAAKRAFLKPYVVEELQRVWNLQEESRAKATQKINELDAFITGLEK